MSDERKRITDYNTVPDPDENYYVLVDNGTEGTGKASVKQLGPYNMISDAYDSTATYAVGDVCIHNNILYVCNTEIDTPHAFDLSEWDPDTLGNYCSKLNGDVSEINSALSQLWVSSESVTNQDFNSLPLGIIYNSGTCANSPISGTVYMLVLTIAINNANLPKAQFAIDFNGTNANSDIYFRNQTAGSWRAWKKLNNN